MFNAKVARFLLGFSVYFVPFSVSDALDERVALSVRLRSVMCAILHFPPLDVVPIADVLGESDLPGLDLFYYLRGLSKCLQKPRQCSDWTVEMRNSGSQHYALFSHTVMHRFRLERRRFTRDHCMSFSAVYRTLYLSAASKGFRSNNEHPVQQN